MKLYLMTQLGNTENVQFSITIHNFNRTHTFDLRAHESADPSLPQCRALIPMVLHMLRTTRKTSTISTENMGNISNMSCKFCHALL